MLVADWSITTATRMALTCQEIKKGLESAARARKGLRMLARHPVKALKADVVGLFKVSELHLATWDENVRYLVPYVRSMKNLEKIVLRPGMETYARRASDLLSLTTGRAIVVESRTCASPTPWQRASASVLRSWMDSAWPPELNYNFRAHLRPLRKPRYAPVGPGFDFPLGDSTDDEED